MILIEDFPLAPTVNKMYTVSRHNLKRRIPSKEYQKFKKEVLQWEAPRINLLRQLSKTAQMNLKDSLIKVHIFLCVNRQTIITKQGKLKKWDSSNRVKATLDALSEILEIDDKYFSLGNVDKVLTEGEEHTIIGIEFSPMLRRSDVIQWVKSTNQSISYIGVKGTW